MVAFAAVEGGRRQDPGPCRPKARTIPRAAGGVGADRGGYEGRGIDREYAMYENEGHGYHRTDRFLAKHLGGRAE